jgi:hypothetical protein
LSYSGCEAVTPTGPLIYTTINDFLILMTSKALGRIDLGLVLFCSVRYPNPGFGGGLSATLDRTDRGYCWKASVASLF